MVERKAFPLRMSPQLYSELEAWAAAEFRSVNGQIEFLLKRAVSERTKKKWNSATTEVTPESASQSDSQEGS